MPTEAVHKPFDSTLKEMAERRLRPWMSLLLGRPVGEVEVINADLSTITTEADKLFRITDPRPHLVHNEFETSYKAEAPLKGLRYSVLARVRHGLPVQTIFVLVRPQADGEAFTGTLEEEWPDGTKYLRFRYNVVRVWELPTEPLLAGDLATLPLAPISRVPEDVNEIARRVDERIGREATPDEAPLLRAATGLLLGLNYSGEQLRTLLQGLHGMKESATYQMIREEGHQEGRVEGRLEGELREARRMLLLFGCERFGPAAPEIIARIESIDDLDQIHGLTPRLLTASSWADLLPAE